MIDAPAPMPALESLSVWRRLLLAVAAILITLSVIFILSLIADDKAPGQTSSQTTAPTSTPTPEVFIYQGVPLDATLLRLDKRALDEAYEAQILKLFGVWLTSGAPEDAKNFINGLRIARRAYTLAAAQITKREAQILAAGQQEQQQLQEQPQPQEQPK